MREIKMIAWINALTDMPDWHRKIFDPDFTFEWKSAKDLTGYDVTRSMVDWCVDEVAYYVHDWIRTRIIPVIDGGVLKSDECPLKKIAGMMNSPSTEMRRHTPVDTNGFRSMSSLRTTEEGGLSAHFLGNILYWPSLTSFWLRIDGYINNVDPVKHSALYGQVEILIDHLVPLFNRTLIDLKAPGYQNQRIHLVRFGRNPFIKREPPAFRPPEQRAYEQWLDRDGRYKSSIFVDLKREFWNVGVQMVLQIREINLAPHHPKYDGEEWHVQGQTNERICATASYIYSTSNICSSSTSHSPATLSFRRKIFPEEAIAAKGEIRTPPFLPEIYGAKHGDPIIQRLGDVTLRENRVVVWPNVFQTKLDPFELEDKSKEGHLRILTLHLIDPNRRIMSTAMIPCQRRDWWAEAVRHSCPALYRLPLEIFTHIIASLGEDTYPISMAEDERIRKEFVAEREEFCRKHTEAMEGYEEWDFYGEPGVGDDE
ncbi:MAG: hypothetical protein Q9194_006909, partial [Teloschistes cf. exilis]